MLGLLLVLFFLPFAALADERTEVKKTMTNKIEVVLQLLRDPNLDKATRNQKILNTVNPIFDFKLMAHLSLGQKYWKQFSAAQKKEFSTLFVKRLQESYLEKLDLYTDEDVTIDAVKQSKANRIEIVSHLVTKDDKKEMIYKFHRDKKKGWMVYDVEILGVSIVQTYRSQFAGVLKTGSVEALLKKLQNSGQFNVPDGQ